MPIRLEARAAGFPDAFTALVEARREESVDVREAVTSIIARVRAEGDGALCALSERFDRFAVTADRLRLSADELAAARGDCASEALAALELAAERIRAFHTRLLPEPFEERDAAGVRRGVRWTAVDAVGLYVPGGTAAYPSSVLMNAIPAKVAGCGRVAMTVPAPGGRIAPSVLAAASVAGVDEVYRVGGAQAVAALAYGTATIAAVDNIVGPGNAWVAEAKRQVFGRVGIDMIAGPSEVVIVAEPGVEPAWIAADLLSQAEHDPAAQSILITSGAAFADAVEAAVAAQLAGLERREIAQASWQRHGTTIVVDAIEDAVPLVDRLAPEHLQLVGARAEALAPRIHHAGSMFLGPWTPEVIGDYVGGPNHVLPTGRTARFASGLSVHDFMKRTTWLACDRDGFGRLAPAAATLARAEGLGAHAASIEIRGR